MGPYGEYLDIFKHFQNYTNPPLEFKTLKTFFKKFFFRRTPSFNFVEDEGYPKHWFVSGMEPRPLSEDIVDDLDSTYRDRLRTVLSVDDAIDGVMARLDQEGMLVSAERGDLILILTQATVVSLPYEIQLCESVFILHAL